MNFDKANAERKRKAALKPKSVAGIYKITSPMGTIYIGQCRDMQLRWKQHGRASIKNKSAIKESMDLFGRDAHVFEIIHELPPDVSSDILHQYEILYIDLHRCAGSTVLNLTEGGIGGKPFPELKERMKRASAQKITKPGWWKVYDPNLSNFPTVRLENA